MTDGRLITTTSQLQEFCAALAHEQFVTIDTEFIREKTYFPRLCLVQLAGETESRAVDPLAEGIDLAPLFDLLRNPAVLKVFHAGRQDLEIFYHAMGGLPAPLFDTQIAAQAAGFGESVSYSELVQALVGVRIDKASRYTDWARRPLSERQLAYALDDVIHLRTAYAKLCEKLESSGRGEWVAEEMQALYAPAQYVTAPEDAWKRLKFGNMRPKQLAALRALAAWREEQAIKRDIPRGHVMRDEGVLEIAASLPPTREDLSHIRGLERLGPKVGDAVVELIQGVLASAPESWPQQAARVNISPHAAALAEMLQLLLKLRATEMQVTARLIAGRDELERFALGHRDVRFLHGWRHEVFGAYAQALASGALTIGFDAAKGRIALKECPQ